MPRAASIAGQAGLAPLLLFASCATYTSTTRVFEGRVEEGPVIDEAAYALYLQGALAEAAERWPQALQAYDQALREAPNSAQLHARLGRVACKLGVSRRADAEFTRASEIDAHSAPLLQAQAECAASRGRFRAAVEYAEQALALAPDDIATTHNLAELYERTQQPALALAHWVSFAVTHPEAEAAWSGLLAFTQKHSGTEWATLARERTAPHTAATFTYDAVCPSSSRATAGRTEILAALKSQDEPRARQIALACRLPGVDLAELALQAGSANFALVEAVRILRAEPNNNEVLALALLAAHRAQDDAAFEQLLLADRQLTSPTPRSRSWTLQLLRERGF